MSFNEHQQHGVDILLSTNFKKQYDLIPNEFKNNYWFEYFLWQLADNYKKINSYKKYKLEKDPKNKFEFSVSESEEEINTKVVNFLRYDDAIDKHIVSVTLGKDGTLHFSYVFAYIHDKEYVSERDDVIYELAMKLSEDKKTVLVEHTTASNKEKPWKCYMGSIFDTYINEICRVTEAIDIETNEVLYHEKFTPVGTVDSDRLKAWHKQAESKPIQLLGIAGGNTNVQQVEYHQNVRQVYVGKCTIGENTRYAICWKPNCFVDKSYQESFQSICKFSSPGLNLSYQLDLNEKPWLVEISEEDYNNLIGNAPEKETPQFKKILK